MGEELQWLKEVSRSFYLSLRLLPVPMRRAAVWAYLMARVSDTMADTGVVDEEHRLEALMAFARVVESGAGAMPNVAAYEASPLPEGEHWLMSKLDDVWLGCQRLPESEFLLVRQVLRTIVSGQEWDVRRFSGCGPGRVIALEDDSELEEYTYRVAGCVGEFWTSLGILTMGERFSPMDGETLRCWGREYGKGLQLVNVLRDMPQDLAMGRCYLPAKDPWDREVLMTMHRVWREKALEKVTHGMLYADAVTGFRLRLTSGLPADIAIETLRLMDGVTWEGLAMRVKVPRWRVYGLMLRRGIGGLAGCRDLR